MSTGGAERMLQKLVRALDAQRYRSAVVSLTSEAVIGKELEQEGMLVAALGGRGGILLPHQFWKLVRTYRDFRPDLVHSWMYHANVVSQALVRRSGHHKPGLVISVRGAVHAPEEQKLTLRAVRRVDAALSSRADGIVFNSQRAAEQHAALGYDTRRIEIIPNGFDNEQYRPMPAERERVRQELGCGDGFLVGLVARFERVKGQRFFLLAARNVVETAPECRFVMAGRGCDADNQELRRWLAELRLEERVYLLGERRDIAAIDNALDVAICSSSSESFPNAIGEAMACGTPAIVTDVGDCRELVGDTGFTVPPRDPTALGEAILRMKALLTAERAALGINARKRITKEYSLERIARQFSDLYQRCAPDGNAEYDSRHRGAS